MNILEKLLFPDQKEWIENPNFEDTSRVHNWRRYVPQEIEDVWNQLLPETRIAVIMMAEIQSDKEEWD